MRKKGLLLGGKKSVSVVWDRPNKFENLLPGFLEIFIGPVPLSHLGLQDICILMTLMCI